MLAASALRRLSTFAQEFGFLRFNIGAAVRVPPIKNTLAERIMSEVDALLMIRQEPALQNRVLLTVLYGGGLRISEVCGVRWPDLTNLDEAGQATVFGKGGKTRVVLLSPATWKVLTALRGEATADAPVFRSRKSGALDPSAVHRIVKAAAARAGLQTAVSAHWLRHAHASHSLDRGAPIHLVQATLGHASVATTGRYLHARPSESSARFLGV
ncbi:tyrosine-type recombinase/integrase [Methylobacterium trifolii]|uniref:tyrosine-type recombinase/integrase n=1 Tax=Methylobacterium trifolii TaxID=1003092 RepID=UPI0035A23775